MEGMYWDDLRAVIRRAQLPWRWISYYRAPHGFENTITICDYSLPSREGFRGTITKDLTTAEYHQVCSIVCNSSYLDGYIPTEDITWLWNDEEMKWERKPVRGYRATLKDLIARGCIEKTVEVRRLLGELTPPDGPW